MLNVTNDYLNLVGIKLVVERGGTYLNTPFLTCNWGKYLPEGLAAPSSPIGVGAKLPTSDTSRLSIAKLSSKSGLMIVSDLG